MFPISTDANSAIIIFVENAMTMTATAIAIQTVILMVDAKSIICKKGNLPIQHGFVQK